MKLCSPQQTWLFPDQSDLSIQGSVAAPTQQWTCRDPDSRPLPRPAPPGPVQRGAVPQKGQSQPTEVQRSWAHHSSTAGLENTVSQPASLLLPRGTQARSPFSLQSNAGPGSPSVSTGSSCVNDVAHGRGVGR